MSLATRVIYALHNAKKWRVPWVRRSGTSQHLTNHIDSQQLPKPEGAPEQQQPFPFMKLPLELRMMVYENALLAIEDGGKRVIQRSSLGHAWRAISPVSVGFFSEFDRYNADCQYNSRSYV